MSSHPTVVPSSRQVVGQSGKICGNLWYGDDSPHLVLKSGDFFLGGMTSVEQARLVKTVKVH